MSTKSGANGGQIPTVVAVIEDIDTGSYFLELQFTKVDGETGSMLVDRAMRHNPGDVVRSMLRAGASLPKDPQEALRLVAHELLLEPTRQYAVTRRTGWAKGAFVLPDCTIGNHPRGLRFKATIAGEDPISLSKGTIDGWRKRLKASCEASSYLVFGVAVGLAGPVMRLVAQEEGVIFNLHGESATGKTLVELAAQSAQGRARRTDLPTLDISDRGLEELAFRRNHLALVLDEMGRIEGSLSTRKTKQKKLAYTLPSGTGRIRSAAVSGELPDLTWSLIGLSSSEDPLDSSAPGGTRAAGEQVRLIDIPVPSKQKGGIFDRIASNEPDAQRVRAQLAAAAETAIDENFGVALRAFLHHLTNDPEAHGKKATADIERFVIEVGAESNPWEARFARKFGVLHATLGLAADVGVVPFTRKQAHKGIARLYRRARKAIATPGEIANEVTRKIASALEDRNKFPIVRVGASIPPSRRKKAWGVCRKDKKHGRIVAIDPRRFAMWAGSAPNSRAVLSELMRQGVLLSDSEGNGTRQVMVKGWSSDARPRFVCIPASALKR